MSDGEKSEENAHDEDVGSTTNGTNQSDRPPVPESPEMIAETDDHVLALEDLRYPEFEFDSGSIAADGSFDLWAELDRERMHDWLTNLADGLVSHDIAVETADKRVTLGVAPEGINCSFDPGTENTGSVTFTIELSGKAMTVQNADDPKVGARGGRGFIPKAMLTEADGPYRCYNWIEDPTADVEVENDDQQDADDGIQ